MSKFTSLFLALLFVFNPLVILADDSTTSVTVVIASCSDGIDNDGDSLIDYPSDLGCSNSLDNNETDTTQCSDGIDNDGDSLIDYPSDLGCDSLSDNNESNPVAPPSGGGGGGGGYFSLNNESADNGQIAFNGRAYPDANIVILKGSQIINQSKAGKDAFFSINIPKIVIGNHVFVIYAEDLNSVKSTTLTFPVNINLNSLTTVGNIIIPPTIYANKTEVKSGDVIKFNGQTFPESSVKISINQSASSEIIVNTVSDKSGNFSYEFNSGLVTKGVYGAKASFSKSSINSVYGKSTSFVIGDKNVDAPPFVKRTLFADLNEDGRVNIVDFSILAFWYKRSSPPIKNDLNKDGKVDIADFSIMAYYWTG